MLFVVHHSHKLQAYVGLLQLGLLGRTGGHHPEEVWQEQEIQHHRRMHLLWSDRGIDNFCAVGAMDWVALII